MSEPSGKVVRPVLAEVWDPAKHPRGERGRFAASHAALQARDWKKTGQEGPYHEYTNAKYPGHRIYVTPASGAWSHEAPGVRSWEPTYVGRMANGPATDLPKHLDSLKKPEPLGMNT